MDQTDELILQATRCDEYKNLQVSEEWLINVIIKSNEYLHEHGLSNEDHLDNIMKTPLDDATIPSLLEWNNTFSPKYRRPSLGKRHCQTIGYDKNNILNMKSYFKGKSDFMEEDRNFILQHNINVFQLNNNCSRISHNLILPNDVNGRNRILYIPNLALDKNSNGIWYGIETNTRNIIKTFYIIHRGIIDTDLIQLCDENPM